MANFAIRLGPFQLLGKGPTFLLALLSLIQLSTCQYYLEDKTCAVLHSSQNYEGDHFIFKDSDQSINLADDPKVSTSGWNTTGSITIESGCELVACNETYFDGACQTLLKGEYATTGQLNLTDLASASCTCHKECKCDDIFMKKTTCARAYMRGGCRTCHSFYTDLEGEESFFPEEFDGVEAFRIRKGCSLTLYSEPDYEEEEDFIDVETKEDYKGTFRSYKCECDDSLFEPRPKPPRPPSYPPLVDIPETLDDVIKMMTDKKYSNHPGLRASHLSLKHGRSSKNAYILLLGSTGAGKSSAINLLFDNDNVTKVGGDVSTTTDIHEFRIPVPIDEIGVGNSELRVIDTPGLGDTRGLQQDATFLATLDAFLTNHEELKDRIPNVVLIFHKFHDNRFNGEGSSFVKMLRGLDSFREKITDENYSNVIFVLSHFCSETKANQKRPDLRLSRFKSVIENYSLFPKPTIITVAENKAKDQELPMVNGFFRLPNQEFYPKNLFEKLELVTEKGGDMIGLGVFRSAFRDSDDFNVTSHTFRLVKGSSKIDYYFRIISNAYFSIEKTEVSQLLQHTWDEKLDANLKKQFPGSLPYLQKALSIRNVNTKEDVPKTTTGILGLLTAIKHDDATRVLLKRSLNIQAPHFPQNTIAGYSYNVFKDTYLPSSPFKLGDVHGSDIGFLIPKTLTCRLEPSTKQNFHVFNTREEYLQHRLQSLGIEGNIANESFQGTVKPGHNIKEISFKQDSCSLSATREFRLFDFVLNDKLDLTEEFENAVKSLPVYDETDHENVEVWTKFFNDYGTHVVKSVHGGGAIEIQLHSNKPYDNTLAKALFDLVQFAEEMSFMIVGGEEEEEEGDAPENGGNSTKVKTVISDGIAHSLTFKGGDTQFHTTDLTKMSVEKASKLLTGWKKSLKFNPSVLTTEMRLVPIGQVVKKLGQNYSTEIERATSLLFKSELKFVPPKKHGKGVPTADRQNTELMNSFLQMQAQSNQKINEMMMELKKMEVANEQKRQEMEERRLKWEQEQKEEDRQYRQAQLQAQNQAEEMRAKYLAETEMARMEQEAARARQQQAYQAAAMAAQAAQAKRTEELFKILANQPPPKSGGCLKEGTKILMADMSEKAVETLNIGDLVMDKDFKPVRVLGASFELLMDHKFYGFDNRSFFFTDSHLFAGPSETPEGLKLYAQSLSEVYRLNPLMEYLNVEEFGGEARTGLFHLKKSRNSSGLANSLETSSFGIFEDPVTYPQSSRIYFLIVDSPTGTYFADGFVTRHDIPPFEIWPNTMGLLFRLTETETFKQFAEIPFDVNSMSFLEEVTDEVAVTIQTYIDNQVSQNWGMVGQSESDGERSSVISIADIDLENSISSTFDNPSVSSIGIGLYAKVGRVISPYLDNASYGQPDSIGSKLGQVQHEILTIMEKELQKQLKLYGR